MMLEITDKWLIEFFDKLYKETNSTNKSEKTNNIYICILQTSRASATSIDILANIRLLILRKTVDRQKKVISNEHKQSVNNYSYKI
ncbi:hypothetical protein RhiirC2_798392 [Rhizophagus irregularis]|uniref:Uncharacterized protein n=2 Tax=Rhizophagus irregularis TaxID=588596 RepID=A0A2N1M6K8_9GLOM|nr:hypothetical protein RhiirC2_798392 [Rhizophagus irregularis]